MAMVLDPCVDGGPHIIVCQPSLSFFSFHNTGEISLHKKSNASVNHSEYLLITVELWFGIVDIPYCEIRYSGLRSRLHA